MRHAAKLDGNHRAIVEMLRAVGCSVQSLAAVGEGCPDLLVGRLGKNWLLEVKDGSLVPSAQKLTPAQVKWHQAWRGQVAVVRDREEALRVVGVKAA